MGFDRSEYVVTLGHAVSDENKKGYGGKPGDQKQNSTNTSGEVLFQDWYISGGRSWGFLLRARDRSLRDKIAEGMIKIVRNPRWGYDKGNRYTGYDACKPNGFDPDSVTHDVECDCSVAANVAVSYAGIKGIPRESYTGSMLKDYENTDAFVMYTDDKHTKSDKYLKVGDILVRPGAHDAIVVNVIYHLTRNLKRGCQGTDVRVLQTRLNELLDSKLTIDGDLVTRHAKL